MPRETSGGGVSGRVAFVIHSDPGTAARVASALTEDGFRTGTATRPDVARQVLEALVPEVALVEVALLRRDGGDLQRWFRASPDLARVPVVALANGRPETRREALRLGLTNVLDEPFHPEDLVLAARAAVGDAGGGLEEKAEAADGNGADPAAGDSGELRGSLAQLPVADLLSMIEIHRRSGVVKLERDGLRADFRYEHGQLASGELSDGRQGEEALGEVLGWRQGTFTASLASGSDSPREGSPAASRTTAEEGAAKKGGTVSSTVSGTDSGGAAKKGGTFANPRAAGVPEKGGTSSGTSSGAPRIAPARNGRQAEVEALFGDPGEEGDGVEPWQLSLHLTLSTLNLAVSYAAATAGPERVADEAEGHRRRLEARHPPLALFFVDESGVVSLRPGIDPTRQPPETVEAAARIWLEDLFASLSRVQPADFARHVLDGFIASVAGDDADADRREDA